MSFDKADDDLDDTPTLPAAFQEHPSLRNGYIRAFVNASFRGATHTQTYEFLDGICGTIESLLPSMKENEASDLEAELLDMARTLRTVENRLGVNPDQYITYYFLCPLCWRRYSPDDLYSLPSSDCSRPRCHGTLYTMKRTSTHQYKKSPLKVYPYHSLRTALRRLLLRPGIYDALQHWRQPGDEPGEMPPITFEEWFANLDVHRPMTDIYDGWLWRSLRAFCTRRWDSRAREVVDEPREGSREQRFVALEMGLVFHINIDW